MTYKPRILVDADGVLLDFTARYLELNSWLNKRDHVHGDVTNFDFTKCVATAEQDARIWQHLDDTVGLIDCLPVIDGALAALDELRSLGEVICVTSPAHTTYWVKERMSQLMSLGFTKRQVVFASDKALIHGDILIDDKLENCLEWSREDHTGLAVLFDAPYNRDWRDDNTVRRAKGWPHAVRLVREELGV